jgi:Spy/CpxP family protein refolding chaperone
MIRRFLLASATLALLLVFAPAAEAQLNLRGLKFPASLQNVMLLRGDAVQGELKLTDDQKKSLGDLAAQLQQEAFEIFSGLQDLTQEEQQEQMPEVMEMIAEKGKEIQEKVDKILEDQQKARLKELSLQARGAAALEDDELAAELKISDEQKAKLSAIREEGNEAMQKAFEELRAGGGDQGEMREKMAKFRKELSDKALAVLTPEQTEEFNKMKGAEFKFPSGRGGGFGF